MTIRQRVGLVEASAIRELRSRICERQDVLVQAFKAHDPESKGECQTYNTIKFACQEKNQVVCSVQKCTPFERETFLWDFSTISKDFLY